MSFCRQEYDQSVKQFEIRSSSTFWSGSKPYAKVISRWQKSRLAGQDLNRRYGMKITVAGQTDSDYYKAPRKCRALKYFSGPLYLDLCIRKGTFLLVVIHKAMKSLTFFTTMLPILFISSSHLTYNILVLLDSFTEIECSQVVLA